MFITCALLQNARTILYQSITSEYFGIYPPALEEYFIVMINFHLKQLLLVNIVEKTSFFFFF